MEATKRPWRFDSELLIVRAVDGDGALARLEGWDSIENDEANGELIVRAVNNHEALLEACTRVRSWLNEEHKEVLTKRECEEILFKAIQQAEI